MPPPPLLPSWSSTTTVNYILSLCWLYLRQKAIYCNLLSISLSSKDLFTLDHLLVSFPVCDSSFIGIISSWYSSTFIYQTFKLFFSSFHSLFIQLFFSFYEWMFFLCNTFSKKKINKLFFISLRVDEQLNISLSPRLFIFYFRHFWYTNSNTQKSNKLYILYDYYRSWEKLEKSYWIFFSFFEYRFSSETAINQWRFFFLFKNLRIACWSCVQKSNHRTRKSDFYWWFIGNNLPADLFWGCLLSIKSKLIDQYRPSQSIENFEILFWNVSYCAKSSRVLLYRSSRDDLRRDSSSREKNQRLIILTLV